MWLTSSSVGRKFIMALTGAALVLFITFHCVMNSVAIFWPSAYNVICEFLGANWYALVATMGLAALFVIHIIYAFWLTIQNRKARGADRYAVTARPKGVEWSSQNMLVLGIVVVAFLALHLYHFWAKMQLVEITSHSINGWHQYEGASVPPTAGTLFIQEVFSQWWVLVTYLIGFVALWFHMTHGFWSMFQSIGWDSTVWIPRLKKISNWWTTIVVGLFAIQAVVFYVQAQDNFYINDKDLEKQYMESFMKHAQEEAQELDPQGPEMQELQESFQKAQEVFAPTMMQEEKERQEKMQAAQQAAYEEYMKQQAAAQAQESTEEPQN
ncbi:MAG: succinate dehydrogenase/fumarate reductase cytochrome b subunit [Muribaculaceae bacterium]|nr:succinate dehydrogenase/fumarate reductase cytochrome b subunit [Muribaculaceae bacterium]